MKKSLLALSFAALLFSCTEVNYIPDPRKEMKPETGRLSIYTSPFKIYDMLYRTDPVTENTFIEIWRNQTISGQRSYIGYYQCFDKDGIPRWGDWVSGNGLPSEQSTNKTVFDITSDGGIIDCFNVMVDVESGDQMPYIQKIAANGKRRWGNDGYPFYHFAPGPSGETPPCESFVAADHKGGAWVAAGNSEDSVVVARVDASGRFRKMLKFDSKGTLGKRRYISRPQMIVGDNDELFLLLQYADYEGMYIGYYDLLKISPDGTVLSEETLMSERMFSRSIYAQLYPDGRGGAYAIFKASDGWSLHLYMEHFNAQGKVDIAEIDLNPKGPAGSVLSACAAVDPESGKCVVVFMDDSSVRTYLYAQVVDLDGNVLLGKDSDPLLLFKTDDYEYLSHTCGFKLIYNQGNMHLYYVLEKDNEHRMLETRTISVEGTLSDTRDVVEMGSSRLGDGYEDCVDAVIDGRLRFWWLGSGTKNYYSFSDKL